MRKSIVIIATILVVSACGSSNTKIENIQVGDVQVRQIPYGAGGTTKTPNGNLNAFIIIPVVKRPLAKRISIVQQYLAQQGKCSLGTTDPSIIDQHTRGLDGTSGMALAAPIIC